MLKVHIQHKAKEDLQNIWLYTYKQWGIEQADRYFNEIDARIYKLSHDPYLGAKCDYILLGYRQYIVFYKILTNKIQIVRASFLNIESIKRFDEAAKF